MIKATTIDGLLGACQTVKCLVVLEPVERHKLFLPSSDMSNPILNKMQPTINFYA